MLPDGDQTEIGEKGINLSGMSRTHLPRDANLQLQEARRHVFLSLERLIHPRTPSFSTTASVLSTLTSARRSWRNVFYPVRYRVEQGFS